MAYQVHCKTVKISEKFRFNTNITLTYLLFFKYFKQLDPFIDSKNSSVYAAKNIFV